MKNASMDSELLVAARTVATRKEAEIAELQATISALLADIGSPSQCKSCGAPVYWVKHRNERLHIYSTDGRIHSCSARERQP